MEHAKKKRRWTKQQKREALAMVGMEVKKIITMKDVAETMRIDVAMLYRWRYEMEGARKIKEEM